MDIEPEASGPDYNSSALTGPLGQAASIYVNNMENNTKEVRSTNYNSFFWIFIIYSPSWRLSVQLARTSRAEKKDAAGTNAVTHHVKATYALE